jgi:hypothetical protein
MSSARSPLVRILPPIAPSSRIRSGGGEAEQR